MTALLFPGQGTQRVGMGQALFRAFDVAAGMLAEASRVVGRDLGQLLRRGPADLLTRTENAQVAVTAVGLAALAVLRSGGLRYDVVAGHSVGMLAALAAADVLTPGDALRLAAQRGAAMGSLPRGGAMTSVTGLSYDQAAPVVEQVRRRTGLPVVIGLVNGKRTVVVSGVLSAVDEAVRALRALGDITVNQLVVSHAFHSPMMAPVIPHWRRIVAELPLRDARVPVLADISGQPLIRSRDVREFLIEQVTSPVRWDLVCQALCDSGQHDAIEVGDSKTLRALSRAYEPLRVSTMTAVAVLSLLRQPGGAPAIFATRNSQQIDGVA